MADRVKVYEEKSKGTPVWAWLLPLLLLVGLLAWFLLHRRAEPVATAQPAAHATGAYPDLGTINFETDKADLTPADQATLDRAAEAMRNNPSAHMRIEGFTDSTGTDTHNLSLSQQRAYAVGNYLKGKGIEGSRLTGEGFGKSDPAATNATESGKADNRRVELFSQQ